MRELLKSRVLMKNNAFYVSMSWENVFWELCKTKFPDTVELMSNNSNMVDSHITAQESSKLVNLIEVPEDVYQSPYLMMECLNVQMFKKKSAKVIYFIKMIEDKVVIGRGQAAHVRLADISISRQHSWFHLTKNNEFYLTDHSSKFGTLILQKEPIELDFKK
jgi:hypothetical protein